MSRPAGTVTEAGDAVAVAGSVEDAPVVAPAFVAGVAAVVAAATLSVAPPADGPAKAAGVSATAI
ncbi:MAG: hypothetical protein ABSF53_08295 [Terracidiphilus sp.]